MTHGLMDWRVTLIAELNRDLSSAEMNVLARDAPGRTVLPVDRRNASTTPVISMSATETAVESTDAVTAAVLVLQDELSKLPGEPELVRVCNYLAAGFPG